MAIRLDVIRVCNKCGNTCQPTIEQFIYSKTLTPDGEIIVNQMDEVVVSGCCQATYGIYIDQHEVGTGSDGVDGIAPIEKFD